MLAFVPLLLALAQQPAVGAGDVEVGGGQFFAIDARSDPPAIVEASSIPYRPETSCFGWVIHVTPRKGEVRVREELRLPAPSPSWPVEGTTIRVHDDRAGATNEFADDLSDGMITSEWCIADGDPVGDHHIEVFAGERLLRRFEFTVVEPPRAI